MHLKLSINPIILLVIFLFPCLSYGQSNFRHGFIITNNSDTIKCYINLRSNYQNSRSCEYKTELKSASTTFLPGEIRSYRIDSSKYYVTRSITMDNEKKVVFLEYLIKGYVDLFYFSDLAGDYFFIEKDHTLYQLSNKDLQLTLNNNQYEVKSNQYIGILTMLFHDSPETAKAINKTFFGYKPLIQITKRYNNDICKGGECIDFTKSTKLKLWIEPFVGNRFSGEAASYTSHVDFNSGIYAGISINYIPLRFSHGWSFKTGISFSSDDFTLNDRNYGIYYYIRERTKYKQILVPVTMQYTFPGSKIEPYVSFSINSFIIPDLYEVTTYIYPNDAIDKYEERYALYLIGLGFDFGLKYNLKRSEYLFLNNNIEYHQRGIFSDALYFGIGVNIK